MGQMFGVRLKALRTARGLSQRALADHLNMSHGTIGMYESGHREPDHATLRELATFFNTSIDSLLGHADDPQGQAGDVARATPDQPLEEELVVLFRGKRQELTPEYRRLLIAMMEAAKADEKGRDK